MKQKHIREGLILDDGGDLGSGGTFEGGHLGYLEEIILYDPCNPKSAMAAREMVQTGVVDTIERAKGYLSLALGVRPMNGLALLAAIIICG